MGAQWVSGMAVPVRRLKYLNKSIFSTKLKVKQSLKRQNPLLKKLHINAARNKVTGKKF
jgi:hypothetical protein